MRPQQSNDCCFKVDLTHMARCDKQIERIAIYVSIFILLLLLLHAPSEEQFAGLGASMTINKAEPDRVEIAHRPNDFSQSTIESRSRAQRDTRKERRGAGDMFRLFSLSSIIPTG